MGTESTLAGQQLGQRKLVTQQVPEANVDHLLHKRDRSGRAAQGPIHQLYCCLEGMLERVCPSVLDCGRVK